MGSSIMEVGYLSMVTGQYGYNCTLCMMLLHHNDGEKLVLDGKWYYRNIKVCALFEACQVVHGQYAKAG